MSERERIVDAVAKIERELNNAGGTVSDDTFNVLSKQIFSLGQASERIGLPTAKLDELAMRLMDLHGTLPAALQGATPGQPIQSQTFDEVIAELQQKAGGGPIQIISNPVNEDGSLTPEATNWLQQRAPDPDPRPHCPRDNGVCVGRLEPIADPDVAAHFNATHYCDECDEMTSLSGADEEPLPEGVDPDYGETDDADDPRPAPPPRPPRKSVGERKRAIEDLF